MSRKQVKTCNGKSRGDCVLKLATFGTFGTLKFFVKDINITAKTVLLPKMELTVDVLRINF